MTRKALVALVLLAACTDATKVHRSSDAQQAPATDAGVRADAVPVFEVDASPPAPDADPLSDAAPPEPDVLPLDAAVPPPEVHGVETVLGQPSTVAGLANRVTCEALDPQGVAVPGVDTRFEIRPSDGWRPGDDPSQVIGTVAGTYEITCVADGLGLRDGTPARWDVLAGPAAAVYADVDATSVAAGGSVHVTCRAADAEGNEVDAQAATVEVFPAGGGTTVDGWDVSFTTAGRYRVDCALPGARSEGEAAVAVTPGPPAALVAAIVPERNAYQPGEVVELAPTVTDAYGNVIDGVALSWGSVPPLPSFGEGRFRPVVEGRYTLRVDVTEPTFQDMPLSATAQILVDAGGPAVACTSPEQGAMIPLGDSVHLEGSVADVAGVQSVRVDGQEVAVGPDGHFAADVRPSWGLNVHDLVAVDAVGNENSTFCSYFASGSYAPENAPLDDAVLLHLGARAVDDGPPDRPLTSLGDLLRAIVNSQGLVDAIDAALRAQNPIVPNECRQRVLGVCILSLGAEYRSLRIGGPNSMNLILTDQGVRIQARINDLNLGVHLTGTLGNNGTLHADYVAADLTFGVSLEGGRPRVRRVSTNSVEVGPLSSDFDGFLTGSLLNLVFSAFEGTIRGTVTDTMRSFLEERVDTLLADVLSGLDVSSLGAQLPIPALGGGDPVTLNIGVGFSTLNVNHARMRAGLATSVGGPVNEGGRSAGIPEPPGPRSIELQPRGSVGAAVSMTLLNQILHRLWRAGLFRLNGAESLLGNAPAGSAIDLRVQIPPAVEGTNDGVRLHLGPAVGRLSFPDLFDEPLTIRVAALARVQVSLVGGNTIRFGDGRGGGITIEHLYLAFDGASVSPQARAALEQRLGRVFQAVIDGALNSALPALPIPDFELPASLAPFGIQPGTRLGLRNPALSTTRSHWILDGEFRQ
jgi:hypothetical protein